MISQQTWAILIPPGVRELRGIGQGAFFWDSLTSADFRGLFPGTAKVLSWESASRKLEIQITSASYPEAGDFHFVKDAHDDSIHGEIESIDFVNIHVLANGSFPRLPIKTPFKRLAKYVGGSGTNNLNFRYRVQRGDSSPDLDVMFMKDPVAITECTPSCLSWFTEYINLGQKLLGVSYSGSTTATLKASSTTPTLDAQLRLVEDASPGSRKSLSFLHDIKIDDPVPMVTKVFTTKPSGTYGTGEVVDVQVMFDYSVTVQNTSSIRLNTNSNADLQQYALYSSGSGTKTLVFKYTVMSTDSTLDLQYVSIHALRTSFDNNHGWIRATSQ